MKPETQREAFATKEDINKLHEKLNDQFKWIVGTMIALTGLVLAVSRIF